MPFSIFENMLRTERHRQRMGRSGEFEAPVLGEIEIRAGQDPLLATNARGDFLPTRRSSNGTARFGFSPCTLEEEVILLRRLYERLSTQSLWPTRCTTVQGASDRLRDAGLEARVVVVSAASVSDVIKDGASVTEGFAGMSNGMRVLVADLPKGAALVAVAPERLGVYTRVADHLGLLFQRVDLNVMVVDDVAR